MQIGLGCYNFLHLPYKPLEKISMPAKLNLSSHKTQFAMLLGVFVSIFIVFGAFYQASTQGDSSDTYPKGFRGGACTIESEKLTIGYSGYFLPDDYKVPEDTIRSPHIPVECGKLPAAGTLHITIDLLYPETARDIAIALRLVKIESQGEKETEQQVMVIPAQQHPSGVITQILKMSETGKYILYLEDGNDKKAGLRVKVPIKVGFDWKDHFRKTFSTFMKKD